MTDTLPPDSDALDWPSFAAHLSGEGRGAQLPPDIDLPSLDLQALQVAWDAARPDHPGAYDPERAWTRLQLTLPSARRAVAEVDTSLPRERRGTSPRRTRARGYIRASWLGIGAVAVAAAVAVFTRGTGFSPASGEASVYMTERAQRASIILPDGSKAILAPETKLSYTTNASGMRNISLVGQAYFMVTADPDHPFTVQTATGQTQVLGTTFSVRAYPGDARMQVAVAEGKVAVQSVHAQQQALLTAGDIGHVAANGAVQVTHDSHVANMFGWASGRVGFQQEPISVIAAELERLYDVTIDVPTPGLASRRVTIAISDESLSEVLEMLSASVSAQYRRQGNVITIF